MAFNALAEPQNAAASNTDKLHIRPLNVENGTDRVCISEPMLTSLHLLTLTSSPSKFSASACFS